MAKKVIPGGGPRIENFITLPVGRFLIDVPENAVISWGRQGFEIAGAFIDTFQIESPEILYDLMKEESNTYDISHELGGRQLEKLVKGNNDNSWFICYWEKINWKGKYIEIKGYFWKNGRAFIFKNNSENDPKAIDERIKLLEKLADRLFTRTPREIPKGPGFCIEEAYFQGGPSDDPSEHIAMHIRLPSHPDVFMRFTTDIVSWHVASSPGLRERNAESLERLMLLSGIRQLKADERQVGPYLGYEVIDRIREYNFTVGYSFMWEYSGVGKSAQSPALLFQMMTGEADPPVSSSLTRKEAFDLWDRMLNSIRYRVPGNPEPAVRPQG